VSAFPVRWSAELEAVIVNTAGPAVAGGDRFALDVTVEPGARLVVTTARGGKGLPHARAGRDH